MRAEKQYRLLAMDLDGTLLDPAKQVPAQTVRAMERAVRAGGQIVFATGRGMAELRDYPAQLPFVRFGILASGAAVSDFALGKTLASFPLAPDKVEACLDACGQEDAMPHFLTDRESVVTPDRLERMEDYHHGRCRDLFERVCTRTKDMRAYAAAHPGQILKVCMYHRSAESRQRTLVRLRERGMELKFSGETSLEATEEKVTKGRALRLLSEALGIPLSACAACGDGDNDLELFAEAGLSVAMGNAPRHVREAADRVVAANDAGGQTEAVCLVFPWAAS